MRPIPEPELARLEKMIDEDWTRLAEWGAHFSGIITAVVQPPENIDPAARYVLATIEYLPEETVQQFDARAKLMAEARNVLPQLIHEIRMWRAKAQAGECALESKAA